MDSDIILCQETKIDSMVLSTEPFPQSYMVFRKDRCLQAGGVLIAIQNKFQATECHELDVSGFEAIWVRLYTSNHRPVYICSFGHNTRVLQTTNRQTTSHDNSRTLHCNGRLTRRPASADRTARRQFQATAVANK